MEDPIVCEARKPGEDLAKKVNYDVGKFIEAVKENVKKIEKEYGIKWKTAIGKNGKFVIVER